MCPICEVPGNLYDGCNHITCKFCGGHYCYLCGEGATREDGHWEEERGLCPFRHTLDDPRVTWDEDDIEEEFGEDEAGLQGEAEAEWEWESGPEDDFVGSADGSEDGFGDADEQGEVFQANGPLMAGDANLPVPNLFQMAMMQANGFPQNPAMAHNAEDETAAQGPPEGSLAELQMQQNQAFGFQ